MNNNQNYLEGEILQVRSDILMQTYLTKKK